MNDEQIAALAYEARAAYDTASGTADTPRSWEDAPAYLKASYMAAVAWARENPGASARDAHEARLKAVFLKGWTRGDVIDQEAKTHPNLVPFDELPKDQRQRDEIGMVVIQTLVE